MTKTKNSIRTFKGLIFIVILMIATFLFSGLLLSPVAEAQITSYTQYPTHDFIEYLQFKVQRLQAQLNTQLDSPTTPPVFNFTRSLNVGSSGIDVVVLQEFLISSGYSIPAGPTDFFGQQTRSALASWQSAKDISPAVGYFGPISRNTYMQGSFSPLPPTIPLASTEKKSEGFVYVNNNGQFEINGQPFRFSGTNAYFLPNYEKLNSSVVDSHFEAFKSAGITTVRMWAFYDGYDCGYSQFDSSESVIQTSPGVYSESALQNLDNVIAKGKEKGIKFILPFINFWDELGGICQYNYWTGEFADPKDGSMDMNFFITNKDTQQWYKDYISMLLNRVNTVTGIAYKNEPAILSWQIMNEARNPSADPAILRDWYQDIARHIKFIDTNHLLSTGEEGFDDASLGSWEEGGFVHPNYNSKDYSNTYVLRSDTGSSYTLNTAIPEIDMGWAHWYPSEYGFGSTVNSDMIVAQHAWLSDHKNIAMSHNKTFVLGEYGIPGSPWANPDQKYQLYSDLYTYSENNNIDGTLIWQFVPGYPKCTEYGGNICYPGRAADEDLYNNFVDHVQIMKAKQL